MKAYILLLITGQYELCNAQPIRGFTSKEAAENGKLAELVRLEEIVRKFHACEKVIDEFVGENTPPGIDVCACEYRDGQNIKCAPCVGWQALYDTVSEKINQEVGFDPKTLPYGASEGFHITVHEVDIT